MPMLARTSTMCPSSVIFTSSARRMASATRCASLDAAARHHDREFVAADPRDAVARAPDDRAQPRRDFAQQQVADRVPERFVDVRELIEVEDQQRHRASPRASPLAIACSSRSANSTRVGKPVSASRCARSVILDSEAATLSCMARNADAELADFVRGAIPSRSARSRRRRRAARRARARAPDRTMPLTRPDADHERGENARAARRSRAGAASRGTAPAPRRKCPCSTRDDGVVGTRAQDSRRGSRPRRRIPRCRRYWC